MDKSHANDQPYVIINRLELANIKKTTGPGSGATYFAVFSGIEYSVEVGRKVFANLEADLDKVKLGHSNHESSNSGNNNDSKKENKANVINDAKQEGHLRLELPRKVNKKKLSDVGSKKQRARCQ